MLILHSCYKGYDIWVDQDMTSGKQKYIVLLNQQRHEYDSLESVHRAIQFVINTHIKAAGNSHTR